MKLGPGKFQANLIPDLVIICLTHIIYIHNLRLWMQLHLTIFRTDSGGIFRLESCR